MLAVLAAVVLSAPPPPSYAMPGLNPVNLSPPEAQMFSELFGQAFIKHGFKVLSARDIGAVLGLERQKQLTSCAEGSSCLTELVASMGADGLILGDVGKLGATYVVNAKVLSSKDGTTLALYNTRVASADKIPDALEAAAFDLAHQLAEALKRPDLEPHQAAPVAAVVGPAAASPRHHKLWAIAPAAVGLAGLGVGIGLQVEAARQFSLIKAAPNGDAAHATVTAGQSAEAGANVALGVGVAGLAAAVVVYLTGATGDVQPTAWVTPGGGGFGLVGVLP
jgi:hypothetical protein